MNSFLEIVLSNALLASVMALVVIGISRLWKNPAAIHVLWIAVLLKLFSPPLMTAPHSLILRGAVVSRTDLVLNAMDQISRPLPTEDMRSVEEKVTRTTTRANHLPASITESTIPTRAWPITHIIAVVWGIGSGLLILRYAYQIARFSRLLSRPSVDPSSVELSVARLAKRLGLRHIPETIYTSSILPPLVWPLGRRARLVLPWKLFQKLNVEAQETIIAHELVHIQRRDYLVRWLEVAAKVVFWWHPVSWYAAVQLQDYEEQCCDAQVMSLLPDHCRIYATALVDTLDFISHHPRPSIPLPTTVQTSGSLSRRIHMLIQPRPHRLSVAGAVCIVVLTIFPMMFAFADSPTVAVDTAKLTGVVKDETGRPLADARVRVAVPATSMIMVEQAIAEGEYKGRLLSTMTDRHGHYEITIGELSEPTEVATEAFKPWYGRSIGTQMRAADLMIVEVAAGKTTTKDMTLPASANYFKGRVVDEQGKAIAGVNVKSGLSHKTATHSRVWGGVERMITDSNGVFEIFGYPDPIDDSWGWEGIESTVTFRHPDYVQRMIEEVLELPTEKRTEMLVTLKQGIQVAGVVLDVNGQPLPNALIKFQPPSYRWRKAARTDAAGRFQLFGLAPGNIIVTCIDPINNQKRIEKMDLNDDAVSMQFQLEPIDIPVNPITYNVLGMTMTDVTEPWKLAYEYWDKAEGAIVLNPETDSVRFGIGGLAKADYFWVVGDKNISSVREFVEQLIAEMEKPENVDGVRVVFNMSRTREDLNMTQQMRLTDDDVAELRKLLEGMR